MLFVLIGMEVVLIPFGAWLLSAAVLVISVTLLAWSGLRGGISVALALSLPPGDARSVLIPRTCRVVVFAIVMFGLMYLNTFAIDHVYFSQTRAWMAVIMGATMAILMLAFMWTMYRDRRVSAAILAVGAVAFAAALALVRGQAIVDDVAYMRAMIPHHSIAVLSGSRAHIQDPRVHALADGILRTQVQEIAGMQALIADLQRHPPPRDAPLLQAAAP